MYVDSTPGVVSLPAKAKLISIIGIRFMNTILIVDDQPANLQVLSMMLRDEGYHVRAVSSGRVALTAIEDECPELILLDVMMPGMNGYETCRQLKAHPATREIPVIFISALDNMQDKMSAFDVGGVDYITKPFKAQEVIARVRTHMALFEQKREIERLREEDRIFYEKLNETRSQFLDAVTHDMKNPISVIRMYVDLLRVKSGIAVDSKAERYLSIIEESAEKLMELVTNILDLARIESGLTIQLQPVSLHKFVTACFASAEPLAR
ncbi:MAG TPA: response regulator, partial [Aggregatilineales bacterium]|nr:response regulator [Aggregatilineales bacterium]